MEGKESGFSLGRRVRSHRRFHWLVGICFGLVSRLDSLQRLCRGQASLRDVALFCGLPGVETPGYFQLSLRDVSLLSDSEFEFVNFRDGQAEKIKSPRS
jgi:hypothetical protein